MQQEALEQVPDGDDSHQLVLLAHVVDAVLTMLDDSLHYVDELLGAAEAERMLAAPELEEEGLMSIAWNAG
jgi:hypothetical protein